VGEEGVKVVEEVTVAVMDMSVRSLLEIAMRHWVQGRIARLIRRAHTGK
jgi:hypothetical protein